MDIVITSWALNSYLNLKHQNVFTDLEYRQKLRPDVLRLKVYPKDPKFKNPKFWSAATDKSSNRLGEGYKMKWHQVGSGKVQLRLTVGMIDPVYLCESYVKQNSKHDLRKLARFKTYLQLIRQGRFIECGRL
jgi:hypothetical protein